MNSRDFRRIALALPGTVESAHMGHPDFRVGGKIFASLGPDEDWAMVKLTPAEQKSFIAAAAGPFQPANGAWGRRGCTIVRLCDADASMVRQAVACAWQNVAPPSMKQDCAKPRAASKKSKAPTRAPRKVANDARKPTSGRGKATRSR
jgi:hypothetical protein